MPADRRRRFLKETLRGFLPDEVLVKKKQGLGLPFEVWATRRAALQRLDDDLLHRRAGRDTVQPAFIETPLIRLLPAHSGYYGELVWILMMLEQCLYQIDAP